MAVSTSDGGDTWKFDSIPVPGSPLIQYVAAWDAGTCYYVFSDNQTAGGSVWKTTDAGASWTKKTTSQFSGGYANSIHLFSADTAVVLGDPNGGFFEVQKTNDGGNSWSRVSASAIPASLTGEWSLPDASSKAGNSLWFSTSKSRLFRSVDRKALCASLHHWPYCIRRWDGRWIRDRSPGFCNFSYKLVCLLHP